MTWTFDKSPGFNRIFITASLDGIIKGSIELRSQQEYESLLASFPEWLTQQSKLESEKSMQSTAPRKPELT